jgi:hypothetical protein
MPSISANWIGAPVGLLAGFVPRPAAGLAAGSLAAYATAAIDIAASTAAAVRCHFAIVIAPPDW